MLRKRTPYFKAVDFARTARRENRPCPFCGRHGIGRIIEVGTHVFVSENIIPYDVFEGGPVEKHYMLIPKEHRESMAQFTEAEQLEYLELLAKYELRGFNSYTRALSSKTRSVAHYHTHLLYTPGGKVRAFLFLSKPYILWFQKAKATKKA